MHLKDLEVYLIVNLIIRNPIIKNLFSLSGIIQTKLSRIFQEIFRKGRSYL